MKDFDHLCTHPRCYQTENDCTMYEVQGRRGDGSYTLCGAHLMERDVDRAEAIVTAKTASMANAMTLQGLKER